MSAFLSGEMKDTVQMNPAGAYGMHAARTSQQSGANRACSSAGAILLKEGTSEIVSQLGRECQHVDQGSGVCAKSLVDLGSMDSGRVVTSFGETQLTRRMISTELIIRMGNLSRFEPN